MAAYQTLMDKKIAINFAKGMKKTTFKTKVPNMKNMVKMKTMYKFEAGCIFKFTTTFCCFPVVISCTLFSKHHFHIVVMMHTLKAGCNFNFITFSDGRCCYFLHNIRLNVIMLEIFLLTLPAKHHMIKDSLWVSWIFEGYAYCFLLVMKCSLNCPSDLLCRRVNTVLFIDEKWSLQFSLR